MLRILIIDESCARAEELCGGLAMAGHQVAAVLPSALDMTAQIEAIRPDVILIETESPSRDTLENLAVMNRQMPRPVILLTQESDAAVWCLACSPTRPSRCWKCIRATWSGAGSTTATW